MLRRTISAAVAAVIAIVVLILDITPLYIIIVSLLSVAAVYELLVATKYIKQKKSSIIGLVFVSVVPVIFVNETLRDNLPTISCAFLFLLFAVMIFTHEKVSFEAIALIAFVSICVPLSLSCLLFMVLLEPHGMFLLIFSLTAIFMGDAGAYFTGTFIGKHKMAPSISPKKTWEGFFGGLFFSGLTGLCAPFVYEFVYLNFIGDAVIETNKFFFIIMAILCSALGVMGDLSASLVKRQCAVKDFGNIMPGHGGVLDRFDSVLFAIPFMYQVLHFYVPVTSIIH
ncbi:MAG: phosphatidate cytidylyltransferase [Oscillospiraceae bacterium]|nr:phosphatidate cytidylyltransferase [Oscillospiraceae bacterium]